jgi:hypothetical protein
MEGRLENTHHSLSGVKCVVNTCVYHGHGDHCHAEKIEIQPVNASNTEDTDCATFAPKRS